MGKGGRPRKTLNNLRLIEVKIRLSLKEYTELLEKVSETKLSRTEYCRRCILESKHIFVSSGIIKLIFELNKAGVNLNQFVKKLNSLSSENIEQAKEFLEKSNVEVFNIAAFQFKVAVAYWAKIMVHNAKYWEKAERRSLNKTTH